MKKSLSILLALALIFGIASTGFGSINIKAAPLEGTNIDSYESLVAQYGTQVNPSKIKQNGKFVTVDAVDGFIYYGVEVVESNGKITDGLVQPGDELDVRVYIKSNMYTGDGISFLVFDNKFFDVKLPAGATESIDKNTGYTLNCSTGFINTNHPMVKQNNTSHTITSLTMKNANTLITELCGFSTEYLASHDIIKSMTVTDIMQPSRNVYQMTSDEYLLSYRVKVKEGLEEGATGVIDSPKELWQANLLSTGKYDAKKEGYFPARHILEEGITLDNITGKMSVQMDNKALDHFILEATHTLTIGKSETTQTYTAKFVAENQTTEIYNSFYEAGAKVEFPASVENQLGWAIVTEGSAHPGTIIYPDAQGKYDYTVKEADVEFLRVLKTDKFPVKFGLGASYHIDKYTGEKVYDITVYEEKLPAGMRFLEDEWKLEIMLPVGQPFDLSIIPDDAVVKIGNEIVGWDTSNVKAPSTLEGTIVTLNTVNGAMGTDVTVSTKAIWTPKLYTVNYYLDRDAFYSGTDPLKTVEGLLYATSVSYNGYDSETGKTYNINNEKTDKKFAGWYDADTGELLTTTDSIRLTYSKNLNLYAKWENYKNTATFMVRDYENGGWVEFKRFVDHLEKEQPLIASPELKSVLSGACADERISFQYLYTTNPDEIGANEDHGKYTVAGVLQAAPGVYITTDINYTGHAVYYIATTLDCEVTWKVPAYNVTTNTFDEANLTIVETSKVATAVHTNAGDPYAAFAKLTKVIDAPVGYAISGWKDAETGEPVILNENGAYTVTNEKRTATLIAIYELVEYPIAFNLRNSDFPAIVMLKNTVSLGESIKTIGSSFTLDGNPSVLPVPGIPNHKQPNGGYTLPEGYKFTGWTLGMGDNAENIEFPIELTTDIIKSNFVNGAIQFNGTWEAQEYNLSFYITNANGEEEMWAQYSVKLGDNIANYRSVTEEIEMAINARAPEGMVFSNVWYNKATNEPDTTLTKMPAMDIAYYAHYTAKTVRVYVDLNNLEEQDLSQTMSIFRVNGNEILLYGDDITEVKKDAPYYNRSFQTIVEQQYPSTESNNIIGSFAIYHVYPGEDPYDTSNWKPGINDEDTPIAKTTLIFRIIWNEGVCGENLRYSFDPNSGKLTITGSGDMYDDHILWTRSPQNIKSVVINNGATSIGDAAFEYCYNLTSIEIPDSVTRIGEDAFADCYSLTNIEIPNNVTSIGDCAFAYCNSLTSANIPDSITSIGKATFLFCANLKNLTIPDSVTSIGMNAFAYCYSLTSVTIPDSVTSIGDGAFWYCLGMNTIHIPSSVTTIGESIIISDSKKAETIEYIKTVLENASEEELKEFAAQGVTKESLTNWKPTTVICSDSEDSLAKKYAEENGHEFVVCDGSHYVENPEETTTQPSTTEPVEVPTTTKPAETEPSTKPVEVPTTMKPAETEPSTKPAEAPTTTKPAETEPSTKPVEVPTTTKPAETEPSTKPVEVPTTTKPAETEPSTKPVEVPVTKPTEPSTEPTTKPVTPPVTEKKVTVEIRKPSQTEIKYGDNIVLHADVENMPEGAKVMWSVDNGNFKIVESSENGRSCLVTPAANGETVFFATLVDADGNIIATDTQTMTSKAGFFQKIAAFFKKLFGLTKVYPEIFKGIF